MGFFNVLVWESLFAQKPHLRTTWTDNYRTIVCILTAIKIVIYVDLSSLQWVNTICWQLTKDHAAIKSQITLVSLTTVQINSTQSKPVISKNLNYMPHYCNYILDLSLFRQ